MRLRAKRHPDAKTDAARDLMHAFVALAVAPKPTVPSSWAAARHRWLLVRERIRGGGRLPYQLRGPLERVPVTPPRSETPPSPATAVIVRTAPELAPPAPQPQIVVPASPATAPVIATRLTFRDAVAHYRELYKSKPNIRQELAWMDELMPFLGDEALEDIDDAKLQPFIEWQLEKPVLARNGAVLRKGLKSKTINLKLGHVRHMLIDASRKWRRNGKPWLGTPPFITMLKGGDERPPRPLTWQEQNDHLHKLPAHLYPMALFDLNVAARVSAICNLSWSWEKHIKEDGLDIVTFLVPPEFVKGEDGKKSSMLIVCNSVAREIVEARRGEHPDYVFTYQKGKKGQRRPIATINNTGWRDWRSAGLIDYPSGGTVSLTDLGRERAPTPEPMSVEEMQASLCAKVGNSKAAILRALIDLYPRAISRDALAAKIGVSATSGGYFNNLGALRTLGVIDYPSPGHVVALPVLFLE
jgi:integrase